MLILNINLLIYIDLKITHIRNIGEICCVQTSVIIFYFDIKIMILKSCLSCFIMKSLSHIERHRYNKHLPPF